MEHRGRDTFWSRIKAGAAARLADGKKPSPSCSAARVQREPSDEGTVSGEAGSGVRLRTAFTIGMLFVFAVSLSVFLAVDINQQRQESEDAMLEEARTFAREMDSVWVFMENSQYTINTDEDGDYQFKGLHCAIVGKSVGAIFSKGSDYTIRYTNFNPRNVQDEPDAFETEALTLFNESDETEYYGFADFEGEERFRYVRALEVSDYCLTCHGDPVGELDETGHAREGWTLDSVGGAISIVIPIDQARESQTSSIVRDTLGFVVFFAAASAVVSLMVWAFMLRPLNRMKRAFVDLQDGELGVSLSQAGAVREMRTVIAQFNIMSAELRQTYESIEGEVRARTADLHRANETLVRQRDDLERLSAELAKESQFKTDLLSMVNHELRTPLTAIITLAQISRESSADDGVQAGAWGEVEKNSKILLNMINDMLDIARSDAGMITASIDVVDLGDVVSSVKQSLAPLAAKYHVELSTSVDPAVPLVMGDYEKTARIFTNLVGNAIKFTPDGGHVRVEVARDVQAGGIACRVIDDGIGISPIDQERIFDRFVQVDGVPTRKYAGSGLGLTIVEEYAHLQGYGIQLSSSLGQGSTFTLTIPEDKLV